MVIFLSSLAWARKTSSFYWTMSREKYLKALINKNFIMKKLIILFILIVTSMCSLYSQTKTIKGRIIDDNLETLPYVSIVINDF